MASKRLTLNEADTVRYLLREPSLRLRTTFDIACALRITEDEVKNVLENLEDRGLVRPAYWELTLKGRNVELPKGGRVTRGKSA